MRKINNQEAIKRAVAGDQVFILIPVEDMKVKDIRDRVEAGATFAVLEEKAKSDVQSRNMATPSLPEKRRGSRFDVEGIMSLYDAGWKYKDIATEKNLTLVQVEGVIHRQQKKRKKEAGQKNVN